MTMMSEPASMNMLQAAILGVVQGVTEFLPISSTAHLRVVPSLLGWGDPGVAFSAVIQLGSVIAVLAYFAKDMLEIAGGFFNSIKQKDYRSHYVRLVGAIVIGTVPICLLGLAFKQLLETEGGPLRSLILIGGASILMAAMLYWAERYGKRKRAMSDIRARDGFLMGIGQAMALVPGCSRSGSTLTFALFLGLKREEAARFSFLLGIPAIVLSGLLELKSLTSHHLEAGSTVSLLVGLVSAAVVSYAAIWWMLNFLKTHTTTVFIAYRLVFGISVIALAASGLIH